mmetsp:Transcript_27191/g.69062  ORF Transcript_27191/g.69062 Transcript_27191/m.69062 type:complete len:134 (+) Transcript_27191:136-537(+)
MSLSFIESPFKAKVDYEKWLKLPEAEQPAALEVALAASLDGLAAAASKLSLEEVYEPLAFPESRVAKIKEKFVKEAGPPGRLPLKRVHVLLFSDAERKEYDFDTWDEDLQATCEGCGKTMAWPDVEKFLSENL